MSSTRDQDVKPDDGILPRSLKLILSILNDKNNSISSNRILKLSYFEIYNDKIFDLVDDYQDRHPKPRPSA